MVLTPDAFEDGCVIGYVEVVGLESAGVDPGGWTEDLAVVGWLNVTDVGLVDGIEILFPDELDGIGLMGLVAGSTLPDEVVPEMPVPELMVPRVVVGKIGPKVVAEGTVLRPV